MSTPTEPPAKLQVCGLAQPGYIAIVIENCPMMEVQLEGGEVTLRPGVKMCARQAMEFGMNIIFLAKQAEIQVHSTLNELPPDHPSEYYQR